jgi:hypothetical protein
VRVAKQKEELNGSVAEPVQFRTLTSAEGSPSSTCEEIASADSTVHANGAGPSAEACAHTAEHVASFAELHGSEREDPLSNVVRVEVALKTTIANLTAELGHLRASSEFTIRELQDELSCLRASSQHFMRVYNRGQLVSGSAASPSSPCSPKIAITSASSPLAAVGAGVQPASRVYGASSVMLHEAKAKGVKRWSRMADSLIGTNMSPKTLRETDPSGSDLLLLAMSHMAMQPSEPASPSGSPFVLESPVILGARTPNAATPAAL